MLVLQAENAPTLAEQKNEGLLLQHTMPEGCCCLACLTSLVKLIEAVSK